MKTICTTQAEIDAAAARGDDIVIDPTWTDPDWAIVNGSSRVVAWGSAHVVARGSAHVVAWGSAHVVARESAHVVAWGSAHVEAWGSAHVEARESAHVVARGSAHVEAWGSAHVVARESAHVVARESAHVEARGRASTRQVSATATCTGNVYRVRTVDEWADYEGVDIVDGHVVLYKALSDDLTGGGGYGTTYPLGGVVVAADWDPGYGEPCGRGLHLCASPAQAIVYNRSATSVVVCRVAIADVAVFEADLGKVRCRAVEVLRVSHLVDRGWPVPVEDAVRSRAGTET